MRTGTTYLLYALCWFGDLWIPRGSLDLWEIRGFQGSQLPSTESDAGFQYCNGIPGGIGISQSGSTIVASLQQSKRDSIPVHTYAYYVWWGPIQCPTDGRLPQPRSEWGIFDAVVMYPTQVWRQKTAITRGKWIMLKVKSSRGATHSRSEHPDPNFYLR